MSLLVAGLVLAATGCEVGTDDEMAPPPTKTVTATPSQSVAPAPATVPVGEGAVSPADVVWAQESVLHVGRKEVDLAPIDIEAFVVVKGGVFVLAEDELWFTDLSRVRGTGLTDVTGLQASADASRLKVVDTMSGQELQQGYDTRTGRAVTGAVDALSPDEWRQGPGRGLRVGRIGKGPRSVIRCNAQAGSAQKCAAVGPVTGSDPVVFGAGK